LEDEPLDMSATLDPRLGWIEAFVAVCAARSYDGAVDAIGITPTRIERSILKLEIWLRRLLVMSGVPVELGPDGREFESIARGVLREFDAHDNRPKLYTSKEALSLLKTKKSVIRLSQIDDFIALSSSDGYSNAAHIRGKKIDEIRDSRSALEEALGRKLVTGHGRIFLSEDGQAFLAAAKQISGRLHDFRAEGRPTPMVPRNLSILCKAIDSRRRELKSIMSAFERAESLTRTRKRQLAEARQSLSVLDRAATELEGIGFNFDQSEIKKILPMLLGSFGLNK
jgi:exonuclease VII small subunit